MGLSDIGRIFGIFLVVSSCGGGGIVLKRIKVAGSVKTRRPVSQSATGGAFAMTPIVNQWFERGV